MANRGFLKTVGGTKRLRFVREGLDANNFNLSQNDVIFDSDTNGTLPIYLAGQVTLGNITSRTKVASWPDLGFTPFAIVVNKLNSSGESILFVTITDTTNRFFEVEGNGLYVKMNGSSSDHILQYVIFRVPA